MLDLSNKSPESAASLLKTRSYLTSHGVVPLKDKDLLYLYHLVDWEISQNLDNLSILGICFRNVS